MKTTKQKLANIIMLFAALLMAQTALAFYNPSTGTWLSRDPIGEPGFQALQMASAKSQAGSRVLESTHWISRDPIGEKEGINLYVFVMNNGINKSDFLGLRQWPYGAGRLCVHADCKTRWLVFLNLQYIPEDPPYVLHALPAPGECVDADAIYFPGGAWKIADNAKVTVWCECTGATWKLKYFRWPWEQGSGSEWHVGGQQPSDWPGNIPPYP